MRILITGADGRLGARLWQTLEAQGHEIIPSLAMQPDITQLDAVRDFARQARPDLVMHLAAYTDVDGCAKDPDLALRVNGIGTQHVALACQALGVPMCYVSTNEVFDGEAKTAYMEYAPTRPINPYGYSKWVGEQAVRELLPRHYIVRTAWLFAPGGANFCQKVLAKARSGQQLVVVTDEIGSPTYADDLAEALAALVATQRFGTYHLVNEGKASRYEFARHILDSFGLRHVRVQPAVLADFKRASRPPRFSPLRNFQAAHVGIRLRPWQEAVEAFAARELA
ncbi:MAG: dTDP-4-dehydrorhamnose reductase [Anaerolineae bacterium]|nr:dTDP-4-dehydrorhamnose reductase [Anaerolineae bacterium]